MKQNYIFKVSKKEDGKTIDVINNEIKNTFSEVVKQAENILVDEKENIGKFSEDMEIILQRKGSEDYHRMKWNKPIFGGDNGYYKGWEFYSGGNLVRPFEQEFKYKNLIPRFFTVIYALMLLLSIYLIKTNNKYILVVTFFIFMVGLVYSSFLTVVRPIFNETVTDKRSIIIFNIKLEIPLWIATIITLANLISKDIVSYTEIPLWLLIVSISIFLIIKFGISVKFDMDKFDKNQQKG